MEKTGIITVSNDFFAHMINVMMSHRLDDLSAKLAHRLTDSPASPFVTEEIIIPSAAMRRYLSLDLAKKNDICANVRFSYLAQWLWEQIGKVVPVAAESPYAADMLSWRIFHILGETDFVASHPRLTNWLSGNGQTGRFELALILASLFEQYLTYRPDWLSVWFEGKTLSLSDSAINKGKWPAADEAWQADLWRRIEKQTGSDGTHPEKPFFEALRANREKVTLPARLSVFCLPAIAPQYLNMLNEISKWVEVDLYVLNPCCEFWLDVVSEKKKANLNRIGKETYHETGNALLAAWGKQTQSYLSLLIEVTDNWPEKKDTLHPGNSQLEQLQKAIHELKAPGTVESEAGESEAGENEAGENEAGKKKLDEIDRSVEVHVCHSLMREVEVLHDQLLALFASKKPPSPDQIIVVTPNVDQIAPLVDAVFGNAPSDARIPYRIVGRSGSRINPIAQALGDIFALAASRFTAADVYDLLLQPLIAQRFGLDDAAEQVYAWLKDTGICWGLDGKQKLALGLPEDDSRSFHDGFYRLFLAYALPTSTTHPFGSRLPAGNPEGMNAVLLGSLWHFIRQLATLAEQLSTPKNGRAWREITLTVLDDFICPYLVAPEEDIAVRQTLGHLFDCMEAHGADAVVETEVIRQALEQALDESARGAVPSGVVTVTSMAGLRNLPYRVICAVGMNDGVFPGDTRPLEFDLIAHAPRAGDMQRRDNDRNVFLDLLLAAEERFYVSYTGRGIRDNKSIPPSVLVSELLDTIARSWANSTGESVTNTRKAVQKQIVIKHPLQAFSRRYFENDSDENNSNARMRSYHFFFRESLKKRQESLATFRTEIKEGGDDGHDDEVAEYGGTLFFNTPLPEPDADWRKVSLIDLAHFFENPSRFLLQNRMGISFPAAQDELPSNEPFVASGLDTWQLADRLLPLILEGRDMDDVMATAKAGLEFPSGILGEVRILEELEKLVSFVDRFQEALSSPLLPPLSVGLKFDLDGETWMLDGLIADLRENGLVRYRYVNMNGNSGMRVKLSNWITHLFLNVTAPEEVVCQTTCHFMNDSFSFLPCGREEARQHLKDLLHLYRMGLNEPLRFFPMSAQAFVDGKDSINAARKKWSSENSWQSGEGDNVFYRLAMRGRDDPLDASFAECAKRVMGPMNRLMKKHENKKTA